MDWSVCIPAAFRSYLKNNVWNVKMAKREYQIYKGLQRPLVFKMFKGRFIYWGLGSLLAGIVTGIVFGGTVSSLAGLIAMFVVSVPLLLLTIEKQKKGLFD